MLFLKKYTILSLLVISIIFSTSCGTVENNDSTQVDVNTVVSLEIDNTSNEQSSNNNSESSQEVIDIDTTLESDFEDSTIVAQEETTLSTGIETETTIIDSSNDSIQSVSSSNKVQEVLDSMDLEEKVYQMFIVTPEQLTGVDMVIQAGESTKIALENSPVGGIIYFGQNLQDDVQTTQMLSNTQQFMKEINNIGLFLCVDEEGGYVARIGDHLTSNQFNYMNTYGQNPNSTEAYQIGVKLAENLSTYGFNVDFAPVSDVDLSIDNGLHEYGRCFSDNPNNCAIMVENIVKGIQDNGISATIKHFPGLGSTTGDTHDDVIYLNRTKEEFENIDFVPIKAGINADTDFVMVGHMVINGLSDGVQCDLSKTVVTDWLRNELNFNGIAITDSHQMSAITNYYTSAEASVKAIQAGIDIVLMPQDLESSVNAVVNAVENGEISEEQINQSVTRILNRKEELGLLY